MASKTAGKEAPQAQPEVDFSRIKEMSYEQARAGLIETVKQLESAQAPLEDTMRLWDLGEALAARCQEILDQAQAKLAERQGE